MFETFDKVYVINLPEREDRLLLINQHMREHEVPFELFEAVKDDNGIKGLLLSMKKLFRMVLDAGYERIWVNEDDVQFLVSDVKGFLATVLPQLPDSFHYLKFGANLIAPVKRYSENLLKINSSYATHSMLYSRRGMDIALKLLEADRYDTPYDQILMRGLEPLHNCYATYPMLATQRTGYSDIDQTERNWSGLMSMTYLMHTRKLDNMENEIPCKNGHTWDGIKPVIAPNNLQPQYPQLWGKTCDCGKLKLISEKACSCGVPQWEAVMIPVS